MARECDSVWGGHAVFASFLYFLVLLFRRHLLADAANFNVRQGSHRRHKTAEHDKHSHALTSVGISTFTLHHRTEIGISGQLPVLPYGSLHLSKVIVHLT